MGAFVQLKECFGGNRPTPWTFSRSVVFFPHFPPPEVVSGRIENCLLSQGILQVMLDSSQKYQARFKQEHGFPLTGNTGFKKRSELFCHPITGQTRKVLRKELQPSSAFSATLEIFPFSPFANTTDCLSPSLINIWWCRTPAMRNMDSGTRQHPSLLPATGRGAGPALQTQLLGGCSFPIHWSSVFYLLGIKSDWMVSVGWERVADKYL